MTTDWKVGDVAHHKPSGVVGKVKWLPVVEDLPFMYVETRDESLVPRLRQGRIDEFERV